MNINKYYVKNYTTIAIYCFKPKKLFYFYFLLKKQYPFHIMCLRHRLLGTAYFLLHNTM